MLTFVRIIACVTLLICSYVPAQSAANLGTLTCAVDPGTKKSFGVQRELSCTFEPIAGPKVGLVGVVKRFGAEIASQEKIVLVWSVLGPSSDTRANKIAGRYLGSLDSGRAEGDAVGLVGGADANITLKPLTIDPQLGTNAAISVIELELTTMKA